MANQDRPKGAEPKGYPLRMNKYESGGSIFPGDFCKMDANGQVVAASASDALLGVSNSRASASGSEINVWDHPDQLFVVQADESDVNLRTDLNLNYNILATAGDSTFNISRMELDSNTGATTAALPLKLLEIDERQDNALGAQVDCIVKINNHQLAGGTGSAGV